MEAEPESVKELFTKQNTYKNLNIIWSHKQTVTLIRAFKSHEVLWNSTSKSYRNKKKKTIAWSDIEAEVDVPVDMCKRRIESLLSSCRRERNKINKSKATDAPEDVYEPKWIYWNEFKFWRGLPDDNSDDSTTISVKSDWCPSARRPPRYRPKTSVKPLLVTRTQIATKSIPEKEKDEYDLFGITVATKLRKMDESQRLYAENIINQALYKGLTAQLTLVSEMELLNQVRMQHTNDVQIRQNPQWIEPANYPDPATSSNSAYVPKTSGSPTF